MMKHKRLYVLGVAFSLFVVAANLAGAVTVAAGPYYAAPSWDQQLPASTRFIVLSNWVDVNFPSGGAAVLDRETGLVWERSPDETRRDWFEAQFACLSKNTGGRGGWKLPSIQELRSLVDPTQSNPAFPAGHPFMRVQSHYWSATTQAGLSNAAWGLVSSLGSVTQVLKSGTIFVWCVRGGPGGEDQ